MRKLTLILLFCGALSLATPVCSDRAATQPACPRPQVFLQKLLDVVNAHHNETVSGVLAALTFPKGVIAGAHVSHSLQRTDHLDNPRIYLLTECGPLTVNLYARTIELAIVKQVAESPISTDGAFAAKPGEILIDFSQFPHLHPYTMEEIVNHLNPRYLTAPVDTPAEDHRTRRTAQGQRVSHDTHACSSCHVDSGGGTRSSLGQTDWGGGLTAIVSPYEYAPGTVTGDTKYCVQSDLQALYDCKCGGKSVACRAFQVNGPLPKRSAASDAEACARLKVVLDLAPRPHCDLYSSRCLSD